MLNAGRSIGDEPTLSPQLVRMAINHVTVMSLQRVLAQGEASDAALAKVDAALAEEAAEPILVYALRGERAYSFEMVEQMKAGRTPGGPGPVGGFLISMGPAGFMLHYSQALIVEHLNQAIAIARQPLQQQPKKWKDWEYSLQTTRNKSKIQQYLGTLATLVLPAIQPASDAYLRTRALLNAGRMMIALERYRKAHGHWPESSDALVPVYLKELPVDPFGDGPIRFARRPEGLVVYSVGPDGQDDGGNLDSRYRRPPTRGFDWGYRLWDPDQRRQPAPELPENVFQSDEEP